MDNCIKIYINTGFYENEIALRLDTIDKPIDCFNNLVRVLNKHSAGERSYCKEV